MLLLMKKKRRIIPRAGTGTRREEPQAQRMELQTTENYSQALKTNIIWPAGFQNCGDCNSCLSPTFSLLNKNVYRQFPMPVAPLYFEIR